MYLLKSKHVFRKLSILILIPYFILCITAGGFHAFDHKAYHGHADCSQTVSDLSNSEQSGNSAPILCDNDHSEDNCIVCKWLKNSPKKVYLSQDTSSFILNTSALRLNEQDAYSFLNNGKYHSRAPPSHIS
ncbi:MAG: hypothetical protein R2568_05710 [Candidatus Scalindua sp.]|nr:hypothetical protein [Candidatus Scalindua sp.]MDV5166227.1 hypothetical protein [Candidatus Scalindua sp.]